MADVWSIKGITPAERESITKAAEAADIPIGRFIVRACAAYGATGPVPGRERETALATLERLAKVATETPGKDRASRLIRRTVEGWVQATIAEVHIALPASPQRRPPLIEGQASKPTRAIAAPREGT